MTPGQSPVVGTAIHDRRGIYRYRLTRSWDRTLPSVTWMMLNPSTAQASIDDPTITRVLGFSRSWGFGSADVVNLFALRATRPDDLLASPAPVGPANDEAIRRAISATDWLVAAWGDHGRLANPATGIARCEEVLALSPLKMREIHCLGLTRMGQPRHPLYLPSTTTPFVFGDNRQKLVARASLIL